MYKKSQAEEEDSDDLDAAAAKLPPPPPLRMMCCEAGVVNDLQELYPKSSERLKWMAVQRREKLEHLCDLKDKHQTWVPFKFVEPNYIREVNIEKLDRMFKKQKEKSGKDEYEFNFEPPMTKDELGDDLEDPEALNE